MKWLIENYAYKNQVRIICASSAFQSFLVEHYKVELDKTVVIPLGVDLKRFREGDSWTARTVYKSKSSSRSLFKAKSSVP